MCAVLFNRSVKKPKTAIELLVAKTFMPFTCSVVRQKVWMLELEGPLHNGLKVELNAVAVFWIKGRKHNEAF